MTHSPETLGKPKRESTLEAAVRRAKAVGEKRVGGILAKTERIRKFLPALAAPEILAKGVAKAALEGGARVSLVSLELLLGLLLGAAALVGKGLEVASKSLGEKVREARTRALTRLEKLGGKARSYGWSQIEKIKGRINEISLAVEGYSLGRKSGGLLREKRKEGESEITLKVSFEEGGKEEAQAKLTSFCEAGIERTREIDSRAKEISGRLGINRRRIEDIRNERAKGVEVRRAVMALRVIRGTGIDMGYKV